MRVKPKAGLVVRDPVTKFSLPPEGREVQPSAYWLRRLTAGDVVPVETAPTPELPPSIPLDEENEP